MMMLLQTVVDRAVDSLFVFKLGTTGSARHVTVYLIPCFERFVPVDMNEQVPVVYFC